MAELQTSEKMFAALAVLEGQTELFRFAPVQAEQQLKTYAGQLTRRFDQNKRVALQELVRSWTERPPSLPLPLVHPSWIYETLVDESPRILGLVCRYLPGQHVRYLLEKLPRAQRQHLPTLSESFALPEELIHVVKDYLSKRFDLGEAPKLQEHFTCSHLPWIKERDLLKLIRELGYAEIVRAFAGVDRTMVQAFLTRFPLTEAKSIRQRLELSMGVATPLRRRAQEHLANLKLNIQRAEDLPFEIGLSHLGQAVGAEPQTWLEGVAFRLPLAQGYALRRYGKEALNRFEQSRHEEREQQILSLVQELAEKGEIDYYWQESVSDEVTSGEQ